MSKELKEQLNRIKRINRLNERYTMGIREVEDEEFNDIPDEEMGAEEPTADMDGGETEEDPFAGMDDEMDSEETPEEPEAETEAGDDEVVEIDVTEVIRKSEEALAATQQVEMSVDNLSVKVDNIYSTIANMNNLTNVMNDYLRGIRKDIDIMKPPTEEEKKEALAQNSYPYNTPIDKYSQDNKETQTDMERLKLDKDELYNNITSDYQEKDVRNSFNDDKDEEVERLKKINKRLANYRI